MFFDLPYDVRLIVWQKARFLTARARVAAAFERRTMCTMLDKRTVAVILPFSPTKTLMIKQDIHGDGPHASVVEIVDTTRIKMFMAVSNETVQITLGTARSTRHVTFRYTTHEPGVVAAKSEVTNFLEFTSWYTSWYPSWSEP